MSQQLELPKVDELLHVYERIKPYINVTPLITNNFINSITQSNLWFKCQNLQKTGSFKTRGAANKILSLKQKQQFNKVCTHSSGNHAQAVAYISKKLNLKSIIVMPKDTPMIKQHAVKYYGAQIRLSGTTVRQQEQLSSKVKKQEKAQFIHPYNDIQIIKGASTIFYEAIQQFKQKKQQEFDYVVFPIGGGGLTSGTLTAIQRFSPNTKPIGVQPQLAGDAFQSLKKGLVQPPFPPLSLAQGVRTNLGNLTFDFIKKYIKQKQNIILVKEQQMIDATKIFMQRMKLVVQMSGALVLAAVLKDSRFKGKKVCCIISGGNIDMSYYFQNKKNQIQKSRL